MKKIGIVLFILIFLTSTLLGCGKQDVNIDLETIDVSEIKKIECIGTTGGIDGDYSYSFSDNEVVEFVGRWSMIDVFVIAVLSALVRMGGLMSIYPAMGALMFALVVIMTMFSAMTFDPRLSWDRQPESEHEES